MNLLERAGVGVHIEPLEDENVGERPIAQVKGDIDHSARRLDNPAFVEKLLKVGVTVTPKDRRSPAFARKFVADELVRWTKPVKSSGVVLE